MNPDNIEVVIASNNAGKIREYKALMEDGQTKVLSLNEAFEDPQDVEENGTTFTENAIKKVEQLPNKKNRIYISDDSGLEVHCLNGAPGIRSARYGGPGATDSDRCDKLLFDIDTALRKKKKEVDNPKHRTAHFTCALALRYPSGKIETFEGYCYGHITTEKKGEKGFGYDPIFVPDGEKKTFSELPPEKKNSISHRNKALFKLARRLQQFSEILDMPPLDSAII